jgi:hypothetical protein
MFRFLSILLLLLPSLLFAQNYRIYGYVYDQESNESLLSAHITNSNPKKHTVTNQSGFYTLLLPGGSRTLTLSYIGYDSQDINIDLRNDTLINIFLTPKNEIIGEVEIHGDKPIHEQTLMGKNTLTSKKIEQIPSFVGIPDLMKAVTTIPGITFGRDGRSSIYVRGGDRGQNLILLEGAKLYNTNHFGGFVSIFNSSIIKQVDVYKGGFPASYGGRVSSVIDIKTLDGNRKETHGQFNLGILNSGITIEGPLGKKVSYIGGLRTTYYNLFTIKAKREVNNTGEGSYSCFSFYDANLKISYFPSTHHKVFFNFYNGTDNNKSIYKLQTSKQYFDEETSYNINNYCATLGNRLILSPRLTIKNTLTYSHYSNEIKSNDFYTEATTSTNDVFSSSTSINEYNFQSRIQFFATNIHTIKSGIEYSHYEIIPGLEYSSYTNNETGYNLDTLLGYTSFAPSNELSIYLEDEIAFSQNIFLNIGVREVFFSSVEKNYFQMEPRISIRSMLGKNVSLKVNYTLMNQFNHVLVSNYSVYEKETWIASSELIPPEKAQQYSGGIFISKPKYNLEFSIEGYYKSMTNLLEYQAPSTGISTITNLEDDIETGGTGNAYGAEIQAKYKASRFSIDASYVLSWNYRQFDQLNNGEAYPFIYDRRHEFSLLGSFILGKHYSLNTNFIFSTGSPFTIPEAYIKSEGMGYNYYAFSSINNYRMPNYHRLDIGLVKRETTKRGNIQQYSLNVYNAYARQNPAKVYFNANDGKLYQQSLFTIVPTISYSLEF